MTDAIGVKNFPTCWADYYNKKQSCLYFTPPTRRHGKHGPVQLLSRGRIPEDSLVRGTHIDHLTSERDGVRVSSVSGCFRQFQAA